MPTQTKAANEPASKTSANNTADSSIVNLQEYKEAEDRLKKLVSAMDTQKQVANNNRQLRYSAIDVEAERKAERLAPDELYVAQHIIDMNIRREQGVYINYVTSSQRALIMKDLENPSMETGVIEHDFTLRTRYDSWQFPWFRSIDGMQQNGYSIMELVLDTSKPGHLALQDVAFEDFGYSLDSKNLQSCEMVVRRYYYTKTQLLMMCDPTTWGFSREQINKVVTAKDAEAQDYKETSLFTIEKVMFRLNGVVQVAWACSDRCDYWIRAPRPLHIGRLMLNTASGKWEEAYETNYPYFLVPYNVNENNVIKELKGRAYLDQDSQEAQSSLMSCFVTAHRRASYLMFSKDSEIDPNNDVVTQSNIVPKSGAVINSKVRQFQLNAPGADMLSAIQALASANMQENSQINYAAQNRQDSRKTATEIQAATQSSQQLSVVQVAIFSTALKAIYSEFFSVMRSRIMGGLLVVAPTLLELYKREYILKPAGDVDVVERLQKIQSMQQAWPVVQNTPMAAPFLSKLVTMMFPEDAATYVAALEQGDPKVKALAAALSVLQALASDPSTLAEKEQGLVPQIQQLVQQISTVLNPQAAQQQQQQNANNNVQR